MTNAIKFLGNTDDVTSCDCCGKQNLKSTVALSIDDADPVYYGVVCAARALKLDAKLVRSESRKADIEKHNREVAARLAKWKTERDAEDAPWFAWLAANGKGDDNFRRIESLGGWKTAHDAYKASRA